MRISFRDPGPCPVCGAAHSTCSTKQGPIQIPQLPLRDAAAGAVVVVEPAGVALAADAVQRTLPPDEFTSGTYRGKAKDRR